MRHFVPIICLVLFLAGCAHRPEASRAALQESAVAKQELVFDEDRFDFWYRAHLPEIQAPGQLWLPLARSDRFQTVEVAEIKGARQFAKTTDAAHGNTLLYLPVGPEDSGRTIEVIYRVHRLEKGRYEESENPARHLAPERLVPVNERFRTLARAATRGRRSDLERGRALYLHVLERMRYDKSQPGWGRGDADFACDARYGNCTDFHAYFIALARSIGIPARFAIGATIPAKADGGNIAGYHCWAEFYAARKWIPVDISEASRHPELADYYFGHHPANRFELSAGRDLRPEPAAREPVNFMVYPILETSDDTVVVRTEFEFKRHGNKAVRVSSR